MLLPAYVLVAIGYLKRRRALTKGKRLLWLAVEIVGVVVGVLNKESFVVYIGLIFGIIPGVSSILALTLFLPFVFTMAPDVALPYMVALTSVTYLGGAATAILLNIPGTEPSAATLIDGYPMTQKGQAGRALGASFMASGTGGVLTVFLALAMIPILLPLVMAMRNADMVFLILLGITFIAILGRYKLIKCF